MPGFIRSAACRAALLVCSALAPAVGAQAADGFPSQPITIVVPSAPGNVNDAVARLIGQELTAAWGQPVIVDNKPGASGGIGTRHVARADKDGHTVLLTFTVHVQNPHLYAEQGYDALKDFAPISEVALCSVILAVNPDFPGRTPQAVVEEIRANPGKYPYGSYGAGTTGHILGELLKREAGLQMEHVPYKGGPPLATDLIAGHVKVGLIAVGSAMAHLKAGTIVPVAITGTERSALLPDVPTFAEAGFAGFEPDAWMGLLAPAGVPQDRVDALAREVARIVRDPAMQKRLAELNLVAVGNTPDEFAKVLQDDYDKWGRIIRDVGIQAP